MDFLDDKNDFAPFSDEERRELRNILSNYCDWGVKVSGEVLYSSDTPYTSRFFGLLVRGKMALIPGEQEVFVAPEGGLPSRVAEAVNIGAIPSRIYGSSFLGREGYVKIKVTSEKDAGPWLKFLRNWMVELRRELDLGRKEQIAALAKDFADGE